MGKSLSAIQRFDPIKSISQAIAFPPDSVVFVDDAYPLIQLPTHYQRKPQNSFNFSFRLVH